jgi:hypothetical protein
VPTEPVNIFYGALDELYKYENITEMLKTENTIKKSPLTKQDSNVINAVKH